MASHTPEQRLAAAQRLRENRYDQTGKHFKKRPPGPTVTKERALRAIKGSCGINSRIARRLDCSLPTWKGRLKDPDWADVKKAWEEERDSLVDVAEATIRDIMVRKKDRRRFDAAKLVLGTQGGWVKEVRVSGGDKPIQIQHAMAVVDIDSLALPVEARRALLEGVARSTPEGVALPQYLSVEDPKPKMPTITITVRKKL